jgi:putative ABC transport system substrate-binding protein
MPDGFNGPHRAAIILAAARNNVPAVYWLSDFTRDGGLLSYGPDLVDAFRRAATYVDRILGTRSLPGRWQSSGRSFDPR